MTWKRPAFLMPDTKRPKRDCLTILPDADKIEWRHEWKFEIPVGEARAIRARLRAVAEPDPHVGASGRYWIRSLYFDNYRDSAMREKLDGLGPREKFRIRYYNHNPAWLRLEKKYKRGGLGTKFSEEISPETVRDILRDSVDPIPGNVGGNSFPLLTELSHKMRVSCLRPKTIVDYTREPYLFEAGNVRVTFDYDLRVSRTPEDFLNPDCDTIPADYPLHLTGNCFGVSNQSLKRDGTFVARPLLLMEVKW